MSDETTSAEDAVASMVTTDTPAETSTETTTEVAARPEGIPEKFWNAETGETRVDDMAKSYTNLESKFGGFTGAPDDYAFNVSDDMTAKFAEHGLEVNTEGNTLYEAALEMAKETGMNQEGFDKLANLYLMTQLGEAEATKDYASQQLEQLGERGQQRLDNIESWGNKNLSPELFDSLKTGLTSAAMVPVMEQLIAQTRNAPVSDTAATAAPSITPVEVSEMQFAQDEFGNRRINTDPAFRAQYQKALNDLHGTDENRIMVG